MFRAHMLIVRRSKLYYTASGIITPVGGRPVHVNIKINILRRTVSKILKNDAVCIVNGNELFVGT